MTKKRKFIVTSILLGLGFTLIQFGLFFNRFYSILALTLLTLILFIWSLKDNLGKNMTLLTLILPTMFTLSVGVFWFLLPSSILAQIPVLILYVVGIYALCSTMNIYSVASVKTIALFRAARGVGFVITLATSFLIYDAILSLRTSLYYSLPLVFIASFPLLLQALWSVNLDPNFKKGLIKNAALLSLLLSQVYLGLFIWPVTVVVGSLLLTVCVYVLLGLSQADLEGRLFASVTREHLIVCIVVFVIAFIATHWGG